MNKRLYSVYDTKTGTYGNPMALLTDGEAMRVLQDTISKPGNQISDHPADFRLEHVGEFNQVTGEIITVGCPRHVIDVIQLKEVTK